MISYDKFITELVLHRNYAYIHDGYKPISMIEALVQVSYYATIYMLYQITWHKPCVRLAAL